MNMLGSSVWKIARIYHKKNHKKFIRISISLSLAFMILICISYFSMSFYLSYNKKMNSEKTLLSCMVRTTSDEDLNILNSIIDKDNNIVDNITFKSSYLNYYSEKEYPSWHAPTIVYYPIIEIDGNVYDYSQECKSTNKLADELQFYNNDSKMILDVETSYAKKYNKQFAFVDEQIKDNYVFINSDFCDFFNIDYNSIIGKTITYKCYVSKNDTISLIDNYSIKGVFNSEIYDIPTRTTDDMSKPLFWLNGTSYKFLSDSVDMETNNINLLSFNDFSGFKSSIKKYMNFEESNKADRLLDMCDLSRYYIKIDPVLSIFRYALFGVSIFVFFISILNLFHMILYIEETQIRFLDMCQAIGLEKKERRLYTLIQNIMILAPPVIISIVVSFVLSLIISLKINKNITLFGVFSNTIIFDIRYYFMALVIFILLVVLLVSICSLFIDKILSKVKFAN